MGNFSVNHYARLEPGAHGVAIHYVMDLAEIPTFEMFQQWGPDADPQRKAIDQAREWAANLEITVNGKRVPARVVRAQIALAEGAGNMQVARITALLQVDAAAGTFVYEDRNYQGRSGWKEIVGPGGKDRSAGLTAYPQDPMVAPPQQLKTAFAWTAPAAPASRVVGPVHTATPVAVTAPAPALSGPAIASPAAVAPGQVVKGDYLSRLLHRDEIGWQLTLIGIAVAFGLGAMHAMSPGHGKTIVAAYLVGSRGTFKHAIFLGAMVTFTHTASVFLLGFVTLFLSKYVLPEKLFPILGAISGLSIVWVGTLLFFRRLRARGHHHHHHAHDHGHDHGQVHSHSRDHVHHQAHDHGDGHSHSHVPEGEITMGSLIALGASGGLVPCPSALVVLLSAISLGRVGLGMLLLVGFSAGLAVVLMGMGVLVLCVGNLLPASQKFTGSRAFQLLPVASAAVIACVGLVMTGVSLGLIHVLPVG
jgi:nickel/cobalt transporter (NicO) family protein